MVENRLLMLILNSCSQRQIKSSHMEMVSVFEHLDSGQKYLCSAFMQIYAVHLGCVLHIFTLVQLIKKKWCKFVT